MSPKNLKSPQDETVTRYVELVSATEPSTTRRSIVVGVPRVGWGGGTPVITPLSKLLCQRTLNDGGWQGDRKRAFMRERETGRLRREGRGRDRRQHMQ